MGNRRLLIILLVILFPVLTFSETIEDVKKYSKENGVICECTVTHCDKKICVETCTCDDGTVFDNILLESKVILKDKMINRTVRNGAVYKIKNYSNIKTKLTEEGKLGD